MTTFEKIVVRFAIRHFLKFWFFDFITTDLGLCASGKLTGENRGRIGGDQLVTLEDEFRVDSVAGGLVDLVATKVTVEFVFVIIVAPEIEMFAIGGQLLFLIQHNQLRFAPGLPWTADIAPEFVVRLIISTADKIVARRFGSIFFG